MPRDLFGAVTDPSAPRSARKWPTVLLSFVAHACALLMLLVIPLMATGALPIPKSGATFIAVLPPTLPSPLPAPRPATLTPVANAATAPIEAPAGIAPEPEIDAGFETPGDTSGLVVGLSSDGGLDVSLPPPADQTTAPPPVGQIVLEYAADRRISVNQQEIAAGALKGFLLGFSAQRRDKTLFIMGAGTLRDGEIIGVLDAAKGAGVDRVGIVTERMRHGITESRSRAAP